VSIRVLIVDDHAVIRTGVRALLEREEDLTVVGEAGDGAEAERKVDELKPDIVLLDIGLPGRDGMAVARKLKQSNPQLLIVFLTMHEDEAMLREALALGAAGYVIKRADNAEIVAAIRAARRGDVYVHPAMTRALLRPGVAPGLPVTASGEQLTRREIEVLRLLARGHTNRQIAEALELSVRTVEGHRANLLAKLGVTDRIGLVGYAEQHGLL
jgi:two-component system, NarL family, response regulator NreC